MFRLNANVERERFLRYYTDGNWSRNEDGDWVMELAVQSPSGTWQKVLVVRSAESPMRTEVIENVTFE